MTAIGASHLEFFKNIEQTRKEKTKLLNNLKTGGVAILNSDDEEIKKIILDYKNKIITIGLNSEAEVRVQNISFDLKNNLGISFDLQYNNFTKHLFLTGTIGNPAVYATLSAVAVALSLGLSLDEIDLALKNYQTTAGRMRIIEGINNSLIIDDTYNSSPQSTLEALKGIKDLPNRKIAILGDMLELGGYTKEGHEEVGDYASKIGVAKLIAVGQFAEHIVVGAKKGGMLENNILSVKNSTEVAEKIINQIQADDVILIKGSQGARMERVSRALMKNKNLAEELLVRQGREWI
jgi:UDP-N-acetylmuramoyl-tripeptide--D-alanyl-D-alanine ligase